MLFGASVDAALMRQAAVFNSYQILLIFDPGSIAMVTTVDHHQITREGILIAQTARYRTREKSIVIMPLKYMILQFVGSIKRLWAAILAVGRRARKEFLGLVFPLMPLEFIVSTGNDL